MTSRIRLVAHQVRFDLRAFFANRQARFFTLVLPVMLLVLFAGVFGDRMVGPDHVRSATYYVPGIAALAVVTAAFANLVISVTTQRETGILKRRRATPVPAWVLIAGRTLTATAVAVAIVAVLLTIGGFAYGVDVPPSAVPAVVLTAVVGAATFCILAYAFSTLIGSADAAQPLVQAVLLPLYLISGIFVLNTDLPAGLQHVARFFPVQHLAAGMHLAMAGGVPCADLGVLALWAAAGSVLALRRFRWTPMATAREGGTA